MGQIRHDAARGHWCHPVHDRCLRPVRLSHRPSPGCADDRDRQRRHPAPSRAQFRPGLDHQHRPLHPLHHPDRGPDPLHPADHRHLHRPDGRHCPPGHRRRALCRPDGGNLPQGGGHQSGGGRADNGRHRLADRVEGPTPRIRPFPDPGHLHLHHHPDRLLRYGRHGRRRRARGYRHPVWIPAVSAGCDDRHHHSARDHRPVNPVRLRPAGVRHRQTQPLREETNNPIKTRKRDIP